MSFLTNVPDEVAAAAQNLAGIGSTLQDAAAEASGATTSVAASAADDVSIAVSEMLGSYGLDFQNLSAQMANFHGEFVNALSNSAAAYLSTEVANAGQVALGAAISPAASSAAAIPILGELSPILGGLGTTLSSGSVLGGLTPILGGLEAVFTGGNLAPYVGVPSFLQPLIGGGSSLLMSGGALGPILAGSPLGPTLAGIGQDVGGVLSTVLTGGIPSVLTNPLALLGQALSGAVTDVPALQGLEPLLPNMFAASQTASAAAGPWQALFSQTQANLASLNATFAADPFPLLHQIALNQQGYLQTFGTGVALALENFPTTLTNVPQNIQIALEGAAAFNPAAIAQAYANQQTGYFQTFGTALSSAGVDLQNGLPAFQAHVGQAAQAFAAGNYTGGVQDATQGALGLFISGFNTGNLSDIMVQGAGGDLLPILGIPALQAQNFTNLLPPGSILAQMAHNYTNAVTTLTNTTVATTVNLNANTLVSIGADFGLPLSLAFSVLGAPVAGLNGLATGASVLGTAIQTGNGVAAAGALADLPAYTLNGFLNGEAIVPLSMPVDVAGLTLPATMQLPFDGLLVAPHAISATATISLLGAIQIPLDIPVGGTPFEGLLPELINAVPEQLVTAITP